MPPNIDQAKDILQESGMLCTIEQTDKKSREELLSQISNSSISRQLIGNKFTIKFEYSYQLAIVVMDLITAELECCQSLEFSIHFNGHKIIFEVYSSELSNQSLVDMMEELLKE